MENANKHIKKRYLLLALLTAFLFVLSSATMYRASAADFHGINIDNLKTVTGYHMKFNLKERSGEQVTSGNDALHKLKKQFSRTTVKCTVIIEFPHLLHDGDTTLHFAFFVDLEMEIGSIFWVGRNVIFKDDVDVNLTNNHYKYFKKLEQQNKLDYSDFTITVYNNNLSNSIKMSAGTKDAVISTIELYEKPEEIGVVDPESPNFNLDFGSSGTNFISAIGKALGGDGSNSQLIALVIVAGLIILVVTLFKKK